MNPITVQSPPNLISQPDVIFRKPDFEASVWLKGYSVIIERAIKCPCSTYQNQPLSTCQNCGGIGWFFVNPIETRALMSNLNETTNLKSWSWELLGTVSVTLRESERLSYMDRITIKNDVVTDNKCVFSENITLRNNGTNNFVFLSYKPINILGIWAYNGDNVKLVKLPTTSYSISEDNLYVIDFSYNFSTLINFNNSISVLYEHELQYHILDIPHIIRNSYKIDNDGKSEQLVLPINAIARRSHIIEQIKDRNGLGIIDNDNYES